jgi:hypothetical protein
MTVEEHNPVIEAAVADLLSGAPLGLLRDLLFRLALDNADAGDSEAAALAAEMANADDAAIAAFAASFQADAAQLRRAIN